LLSISQFSLEIISFVIEKCFLERLPLLTIMAKDDQCNVLALDQIKEFQRAGAQLLFIIIVRPSPAIWCKEALLEKRHQSPGGPDRFAVVEVERIDVQGYAH